METDANLPGDKASEISDEMRLDASTRLRTLTPLHADIAANELSEETQVSQDLMQGPIANTSNDSESTVALAHDNQGSLPRGISPTVAIIALLLVIAGGAVAIFLVIK